MWISAGCAIVGGSGGSMCAVIFCGESIGDVRCDVASIRKNSGASELVYRGEQE